MSIVTKDEAWRQVQVLAVAEMNRDPSLTKEMAVAAALGTEAGKRAYARYLNAVPEARRTSKAAILPDPKWEAIRKHAGRLRGREFGYLSVHDQAEAVADALETPEGRQLYEDYVQEMQT
jgi:hypothetical protein